MTISFRTQTFHDIKNKIADESVQTEDQINNIITSYGIDPSEYRNEWNVYGSLIEEGKVNPEEGFGPGLVAVPMSAIGRAAEGILRRRRTCRAHPGPRRPRGGPRFRPR